MELSLTKRSIKSIASLQEKPVTFHNIGWGWRHFSENGLGLYKTKGNENLYGLRYVVVKLANEFYICRAGTLYKTVE